MPTGYPLARKGPHGGWGVTRFPLSDQQMEQRFWMRVIRGAGCWEWQGARDVNGYGKISWRNRRWLAHRVGWMLAHPGEEVPKVLMHSCDNPPCVRPGHLWGGTQADNIADNRAKGRPIGRYAKASA